MSLWIAGVAFGLFVCYAVFLVVVAVRRRYKRHNVFRVYRNSRMVLMADKLDDIELKDGDKVDQVKVRWRPKPPHTIDGM